MKYPMLSNFVRIKRLNENEYRVTDYLMEKEFVMNAGLIRFAKQLDGKTIPYNIGNYTVSEVNDMLNELDDANMLRSGRVLMKWIGSIYFTVVFPHITKTKRILSLILNRLLLVSWLPVFIIGFKVFADEVGLPDMELFLPGIILGTLAGMILHESGHAVAVLGYGGILHEAGLMISTFIPGAYVMIESKNITNPLRRIQINAAGVEMNLLLSGVSFLLSAAIPDLEGLFFGSAICNLSLSLFNLVFIRGLDGANIIEIIIGDEDFIHKSRKLVFSRKARKKMRKKGLNGEAAIAASYIMLAIQLVLPATYIISIMELVL